MDNVAGPVWELLDGAPGWVAILVIGVVFIRQWRAGLRSDPTDVTGALHRRVRKLETRVDLLEDGGIERVADDA